MKHPATSDPKALLGSGSLVHKFKLRKADQEIKDSLESIESAAAAFALPDWPLCRNRLKAQMAKPVDAAGC